MMLTLNFLALLGLVIVGSGCQDSTAVDLRESPGTRRTADAATAEGQGPSLKLSWDPQPSAVTFYHVFYNKDVKTNTGGQEIDGISSEKDDLSAPQVIIDKTNISPFPVKGNTVCFYIVAENQGVMSDPSDVACGSLQ